MVCGLIRALTRIFAQEMAMAQIQIDRSNAGPSFAPEQIGPRVPHRHMLVEAQRRLRHLRFRATARLYKTTNILRASCRSFLGRIRLQSTKNWIVSYGPAFSRDREGCLVPNAGSNVRAECTEKQGAIYPWVDSVDLQMFLDGFDAGEEWALRNHSRENSTDVQIHSQHTTDPGV